jgi:hypothetical protein
MQGTGSGTPKIVYKVQDREYDNQSAAAGEFSHIMGFRVTGIEWLDVTTNQDAADNRIVYIGWIDETKPRTPDDTQEADAVRKP